MLFFPNDFWLTLLGQCLKIRSYLFKASLSFSKLDLEELLTLTVKLTSYSHVTVSKHFSDKVEITVTVQEKKHQRFGDQYFS